MISRTLLVIVCVSIGLAGCAGLVSQEEPTQLAPGLNETGIEDPDELSRAHADRLKATSYTAERTVTWTYENGSLHSKMRSRTQVAANHTTFYWEMARVHPGERASSSEGFDIEVYSNGTQTWVAQETSDGREVQSVGDEYPADAIVSGHGDQLYPIASSFSTSVHGEIERGGVTLYHVRSTDFHTEYLNLSNDLEDIEDGQFWAYIDSEGLVHEYELTYTALPSHSAERISVEVHVEYTDVGSTEISKPQWAR